MSNFSKKNKFILSKIKNTKLFRFNFILNYKYIQYRKEVITVFHLKKKIYNTFKNHFRVRSIFFFEIKINQKQLFIFNKPKSKVVKKKKKVIV